MAQSRWDVETIFDLIKATLAANLNNMIDTINTEKADTLLSHVDSSAYYLFDIANRDVTHNPFIYMYGIVDGGESVGVATSQNVSINIILFRDIGADTPTNESNSRIMLRYAEAIKRVFEKNSIKIKLPEFTKVISTMPFPMYDEKEDKNYRAIGIELEVSISS